MQPVAIEYIDGETVSMAAVTFLIVGPFEEGQGDLAEVLPPLLSFATTQCELDPRLKFSPRPATADDAAEATTLENEDEEDAGQNRTSRGFRLSALLRSGGYRRLEPTQSATEVHPLTRMRARGSRADEGNGVAEDEEDEEEDANANDTFSLTDSQMRRLVQLSSDLH